MCKVEHEHSDGAREHHTANKKRMRLSSKVRYEEID